MRKISIGGWLGALLTIVAAGAAHAGDDTPEPPPRVADEAPAPPAPAVSAAPASPPAAPASPPAAPAQPNPDAASPTPQERARDAYAKARIALREAEAALRAAAEATTAEAAAEAAQQGAEASKFLEQAKDGARQALARAREELRAAGAQASDIRLSPELRAVVDKALEKLDEQHRGDRQERAEKRRAELKKAHGALLQLPEVRAELGRHAWRVARLQRLIEVAEASNRPASVGRARQLLAQEQALHAQHLVTLAAASLAPKKKASP